MSSGLCVCDPGRTVTTSPTISTTLSAFIIVRKVLARSTVIPSSDPLIPSDTSNASAMRLPTRLNVRTALHHRTLLRKASTWTGRSSSIMIDLSPLSCMADWFLLESDGERSVEDADMGVYDMSAMSVYR